jgi:hypothetical protein
LSWVCALFLPRTSTLQACSALISHYTSLGFSQASTSFLSKRIACPYNAIIIFPVKKNITQLESPITLLYHTVLRSNTKWQICTLASLFFCRESQRIEFIRIDRSPILLTIVETEHVHSKRNSHRHINAFYPCSRHTTSINRAYEIIYLINVASH